MGYDFNKLEDAALGLIEMQRPRDALTIYLYMADGDHSLDGGYLAVRVAECYEKIGDLFSARYWFGRAIEENPEIYSHLEERLQEIGEYPIKSLLGTKSG